MFVTMQIVLSMFCGGKKRAGPRYLDNVICVNAGSAGEIPWQVAVIREGSVGSKYNRVKQR